MGICPLDGKGCMDDLCYSGSCLRLPGEFIQRPCDICKAPTDSMSDVCEECAWDLDGMQDEPY